MALLNIDDKHHVVRYCKRKFGIRDGEKVVGVFPEFFYLRDLKDKGIETFLSCVLYEFFCPQPDPMTSAGESIPVDALKKGEALVRMNARLIRQGGKEANRSLRVLHDTANAKVPAKARVEGLPFPADQGLCSALASNCIVEIKTV